MDLRLVPDAEPTAAERGALDVVLGPPGSSWEGGPRLVGPAGNTAQGGHDARERRQLLLPALWALQERIGWISPGGLNEICRRLTIPPADAYGVASFYALLALEPRPARVVHVCDDIACRCSGALELIAQLEERFGAEGDLSDDGSATWYRSPCLGQCDRAPAALLSEAGAPPLERVASPTTASDVLALLAGGEPGPGPVAVPAQEPGELRLLRRVGHVDPLSLDAYRASGGYAALRRAFELGPEGVVRELKDSKLQGRGGAAFPIGVKWEAVARQPARPHYLVCNADESEPGTFKDRALLEGDPFAVIEAMTIAAYATNCTRGYVYLRGEYPTAHHVLDHALEEARHRGYLGRDILGEGLDFDIEVRKGAGAYICGEETAIFNSIEGERGEPRNKPPFPVVSGLFFQADGRQQRRDARQRHRRRARERARLRADRYRSLDRDEALLRLRPRARTPVSTRCRSARRWRSDRSCGWGRGRACRSSAVLLGGAAGSFVGPEELEIELTFEGARAAGTTLGSGVVLVFDETVDLPRMLMRIAGFFRDESCGQCVPCRVGTVRQEEALARLVAGRPLGGLERRAAPRSQRWASACATHRSAGSARRPRARSSRRSAGSRVFQGVAA